MTTRTQACGEAEARIRLDQARLFMLYVSREKTTAAVRSANRLIELTERLTGND